MYICTVPAIADCKNDNKPRQKKKHMWTNPRVYLTSRRDEGLRGNTVGRTYAYNNISERSVCRQVKTGDTNDNNNILRAHGF